MGVKRWGGGEFHVSEDRGDEKRKGGTDTPFRIMGGNQPKICSFLPPGKNPPSHMEKPPISRLSPPVLPNTKFFFNQASKPKPLKWHRYNITVTELSLRGFGARPQQSGKSAN